MNGTEVKQQFKFDVFISYRHAELDSAVAGYLQKALEHYRIPREIRKKCGKENIRRVFRDEEELGVASDLFGEIEQNLIQSEFLLVVCSPRILESRWCMREIETFIRHRGRENILPVLIEGEPETAFPPILLEGGEPLAADLRGKDKGEVLRRARERLPRLAAPLVYCSYDELYQRHRVYKMRRLAALAGAVAAVSLTFGAVTMLQSREIRRQSQEIQQKSQEIQQKSQEIQQQNEEIQQQNREIQRNYQAKLENQFRYLAQTSAELLDEGDRDSALLVALEALPRSSGDTTRPYVAEARIALERALYTYTQSIRYQLRSFKQLEHREKLVDIADQNAEKNVLLTADTGCLYVWDGESCENLCRWEYSGELVDARLAGDHRVVAMDNKGAWCFDYRTGQEVWRWEYPVCPYESESFLPQETELLWSYDSVSDQLVCVNKRIRLHRTEDYGGAVLDPGHMFHLLDAATGESRSWAPAELTDLLGGDTYAYVYVEKDSLVLSPGGAWTSVGVSTAVFDSETVLAVFPTGADESAFARGIEELSMMNRTLKKTAFLEGDYLVLLYLTEDGAMLGHSSYRSQWKLECWDLKTGELYLSHQDNCMALDNRVEIRLLTPANGAAEDMMLTVTFDNVAVNLDWTTGAPLSRIEDRSAIALNHVFGTGMQVLVTADGYLFTTNPKNDIVWAPVYSAYHYYIGVTEIKRSAWLNGRAFLFTDTGAYCFAPPEDDSCTALEAVPYEACFTGSSDRLLVGGDNGRVYFYDTADFSLLWEDEYCFNYSGQTAALLEDRLAAYLTGDGTVLKVRSLPDGSVRETALDGFTPDLAGNGSWSLRDAGDGKVLVWNSQYTSLRTVDDPELDDTVLWLVDGDRGEMTARWRWRDILSRIPDMYYVRGLWLYIEWPAATADGRYVVIPCRLRGDIQGASGEKEQAETLRILIWDLEEGEASFLPDEVHRGMARSMILGNYFQYDGWLAPTGHTAVFYNTERKQLQVVDLAAGTVLRALEVDGLSSQEVSFTPDGDHLIFQDSQKHICVYNWREGEYTMRGVTPEAGYMRFAFYQDGQVLSAAYKAGGMTSESTQLYRLVEPGVYKLENSVSYCGDCDGKTVVINSSTAPRLYHAYTLDDLIAMARDILDGRELTQSERMSYLID